MIAEFKDDSWRQLGTLAKGRRAQGSIALGDKFMVIGGGSHDGRFVYFYDYFLIIDFFSVQRKLKFGMQKMKLIRSSIQFFEISNMPLELVFL